MNGWILLRFIIRGCVFTFEYLQEKRIAFYRQYYTIYWCYWQPNTKSYIHIKILENFPFTGISNAQNERCLKYRWNDKTVLYEFVTFLFWKDHNVISISITITMLIICLFGFFNSRRHYHEFANRVEWNTFFKERDISIF